ncbi:hypothetical protein E2562_013712 [Oryza meyeriana var. granulata]|uniref:Uncharacterized protein n=1 Tax=Oryza meyeriana var. granulata TaxID=110450 RepID=A0A6G1BK39_9ORYZ|nr:hypothetical protein E2562_013712 [Oryza meyeriana var. granulata]
MHRLGLHRLDGGGGGWAEVASVDFPYDPFSPANFINGSGAIFKGYAVVGDRFILLSLIDSFCFDCAAGTLACVATSGEASRYVPISCRAVHVAVDHDDHGAIYFVRGTYLFACRYSPGEPLVPPAMVETLWPRSYREEGYGFVVHLAGRMLCAVWMNMNCPCAGVRHADAARHDHHLLEGFIYMCGEGSIFAFELVTEGALSYRLDTPTLLEFQWKSKISVRCNG